MSPSRPAEPHPPAEQLRALARDLARAAGAVLAEHRRGVVTVARTKSSGTDVVTAADLASERELRRLLALARPDDGVLGEEEGSVVGSSGLTWVVDPLDGTVNYLYDTGTWSVSVAVVTGPPDPEHWQVLAGAVHDVERDQMYSASLGGGADLDGTRLQASGCDRLDACLLSTGFAYDAQVRAEQARAVALLLPQVRDIRRIGSAAVDLCMVGAGRLDAHVERGLNPWDHAAGGLVATESGAVVTGRDGRRPGAGLLVAAAPAVADALRVAVADSGY